jgi:hypothetical protein
MSIKYVAIDLNKKINFILSIYLKRFQTIIEEQWHTICWQLESNKYNVLYQNFGKSRVYKLRESYLIKNNSISNVIMFVPPIRRGFAPGFINYKKGAFDSQSQVIKFTSCLPMVGGSPRVLRLHKTETRPSTCRKLSCVNSFNMMWSLITDNGYPFYISTRL